MVSAIFIPFRAYSIFMAEWRYAGTSMVNRFILAFTKSPAFAYGSQIFFGCNCVVFYYFRLYDSNYGLSRKTSRKAHRITTILMNSIGVQCPPYNMRQYVSYG